MGQVSGNRGAFLLLLVVIHALLELGLVVLGSADAYGSALAQQGDK